MIDIRPDHLEEVKRILEGHVPECEVRAFGSRARWMAKGYSDLDLAVVGKNKIPRKRMNRLEEAFEESDLPFRVEVLDWHAISESFRNVIEEGYEVIQKAEPQGAGSEWRELPFTEAVQVNPKVPLKKGQEYPFVDMKAVDPSWQNASESEYRVFKSGGARFMPYDTLMARITPCLENGKIARFVPKVNNDGPAFGSTEFVVIRGREGVTENDFAYYLTKWQEFRNFAVSQMTGSSGRQRVPADSLAGFSVPIPELEKQRAITHILGSLDDKIELNRKMNETLEAMARVIFKSWFVDFDPVRARRGEPLCSPTKGADTKVCPYMTPEILNLFPDSFEDSELGQIPKGWEVKTIGEVVEFAYGKALKASNRKLGNVPVFGSNGSVGLHNEALVKGPGIIIGRKGNPGIVTWSSKDFFPIDTTFYVKQRESITSLNYLFYALKDQDLLSLSADSAVPGLNRNLAYMNNILVPSEKALSAFDEQIVPFFKKIDANDDESVTLASLRDVLLPKLISGELCVPEVERLVEEI